MIPLRTFVKSVCAHVLQGGRSFMAACKAGPRSANTSMTCFRTSRAYSPSDGASMACSACRHGSKSASRIWSALVGLV